METLDKHFRALTGASFAKRGRAAADLITQWPAIVGERLAAISEPERIKWQKSAGADEKGGTLCIRSAPGHGLDLQHETQVIIERINAFLGYGAVSGLKITQGHKALGKTKIHGTAALPPATAEALEQKLADIGDEKLKQALKRLGSGALARAQGSPQPK